MIQAATDICIICFDPLIPGDPGNRLITHVHAPDQLAPLHEKCVRAWANHRHHNGTFLWPTPGGPPTEYRQDIVRSPSVRTAPAEIEFRRQQEQIRMQQEQVETQQAQVRGRNIRRINTVSIQAVLLAIAVVVNDGSVMGTAFPFLHILAIETILSIGNVRRRDIRIAILSCLTSLIASAILINGGREYRMQLRVMVDGDLQPRDTAGRLGITSYGQNTGMGIIYLLILIQSILIGRDIYRETFRN